VCDARQVFGRSEEEQPPQARLGAAGARTVAGGTYGDQSSGPPEGLVLLVFVVLTLAASAFVLVRAERRAESDPVQKAERGEIAGLDRLSLLREPNLRRVMAKVGASRRPLVTNIRVAPARVDLTVRDAAGSRKSLSVDPSFKVKESDFGVGDDDALPVSRLDPSGPERMLRAVAERTRLGVDAVDYVTLSPSGLGDPTWYLFLKRGDARDRQWAAAMDGSDLRHPGDPSRSVRRANARSKRKAKAEQARIRRGIAQQTACLRRATDAQAAARCIERYQP
jgi:hypothetical protein